MADKPMDVYLNDHLAGSMLGSDLAEQIQKQSEGSPLGEIMSSISAQIDEDRQTLIDLMERMGTSKNPVKQATTWLAEKASRAKFAGLTSGEDELGTFMATGGPHTRGGGEGIPLAGTDRGGGQVSGAGVGGLNGLLERAEAQHAALEDERVAAATLALRGE